MKPMKTHPSQHCPPAASPEDWFSTGNVPVGNVPGLAVRLAVDAVTPKPRVAASVRTPGPKASPRTSNPNEWDNATSIGVVAIWKLGSV